MTTTSEITAFTYQSLLEAIQPLSGGRQINDPATGEVVGRVAEPGVAELEAAIQAARDAQPAWEARGHEERRELLNQAADAIEANAEALAQLLSREQGKPLNGPNARFEVGACSAWLRATASFGLEPETLVEEDGTLAELFYRPLGVVGAIGLELADDDFRLAAGSGPADGKHGGHEALKVHAALRAGTG